MSRRSDKLLLEDIIESIEKIQRYISGHSKEAFQNDEKTIDAVVRNFEIIGEAANRLSKKVHQNNPQVQWRRIIGFRNRIVHEYFGVDHEIVWTIIQQNLDSLKVDITEILDKLA